MTIDYRDICQCLLWWFRVWRKWCKWWWHRCSCGRRQWCVKSGMWIFFGPATKIWAALVGDMLLIIVVLLSDTTPIFHIKGHLMSSIPTDFNSRYLWVDVDLCFGCLPACIPAALWYPEMTLICTPGEDNMHPCEDLICTPGEDGL